jgi:hypothetical protein
VPSWAGEAAEAKLYKETASKTQAERSGVERNDVERQLKPWRYRCTIYPGRSRDVDKDRVRFVKTAAEKERFIRLLQEDQDTWSIPRVRPNRCGEL